MSLQKSSQEIDGIDRILFLKPEAGNVLSGAQKTRDVSLVGRWPIPR